MARTKLASVKALTEAERAFVDAALAEHHAEIGFYSAQSEETYRALATARGATETEFCNLLALRNKEKPDVD